MENPPPSSQEPEPESVSYPKKLKMSTTSTAASDDENLALNAATDSTSGKKPRYKRRKIAVFFAYCGVGYQGMQKNPGAKTIEGDLEEALFHSGAVPEQDRGCPKRFDWARSARTDKGVSAVGQVVSGRFYVDPPGFVHRLNSNLPPQIRIFGFKRATASFNAKKFCDRRRYVYLLPVFALDPCSHRDRESVKASLGSENELVKCLECSERGRKVLGVMGKRDFTNGAESGISLNNGTAELEDSAIKEEIRVSANNGDSLCAVSEKEPKIMANIGDNLVAESEKDSIFIANGEDVATVSDHSAKETNVTDLQMESAVSEEEQVEKPAMASGFRYGEKERERFNCILKLYVGTHNFHNFTTRTKAEDPSARRFIISFDAVRVVSVEGLEFVRCEVVGQSFMLHQIRKMIGLAVAVMRNFASESLIESAFQRDLNINVPTAPEVGLYLDECFFSSYNNKWKESHEELSMKDYAEEAEEFKMKHIYSHIASTEHKEGVVGLWLHSLNRRNYPDLGCVDGDDEGKTAGMETISESAVLQDS